MLGISYYFLGRVGDAAEVYRAWLQEEPANPIAQHMLAACSQEHVPERASNEYLEAYFDNYAENFEHHLTDQLNYQGPAMIQAGLKIIPELGSQLSTIDIGCGTGMCGPILSPCSRTLTGVDLAEKMLAKAAEAGHYSLLEKAEVSEYLAAHPDSADLIAAADTMIYFGDLKPIFERVSISLRDGAYFVFTVERLTRESDSVDDFVLHPSGRYRHDSNYVSQILAAAGMTLLHHSGHPLRKELGESIEGTLFVAKKETLSS